MANSPEEWYNALPKITRIYLSTCFLTTCLFQLGFINPYTLSFDVGMIISKFQIWRLGTTFIFIGKFSFPFLIQLLILSQYSSRLEADPFVTGGGPQADYVFMLCFGGAIMWAIAFFMEIPFLGTSLIFMIVYCWSRREPEAPISIWGFRLKGLYLPWALIAFTVLVGGSPVADLIGVVAGHLYYFLVDVLPNTQNVEMLKTPTFLSNLFPSQRSTFSGFGTSSAPSAANPLPPSGSTRYSWGTGRTLGNN